MTFLLILALPLCVKVAGWAVDATFTPQLLGSRQEAETLSKEECDLEPRADAHQRVPPCFALDGAFVRGRKKS